MSMRYTGLDIAKGLLIFAVVLFHLPGVENLTDFNNSGGVVRTVYMPVFFVISGILDKDQKWNNIIKRLLVPYLTFYFVAVLIEVGKDFIKRQEIDVFSIFAPFLGEVKDYANTALWFLVVLCQIKFFIKLLRRINNRDVQLAISFLSCEFGYILGIYMGAYPYYISVAFLCQIFYLIGMLFREYFLSKIRIFEALTLTVVVIGVYALSPHACNVSMNYIPIGLPYFLILSFSSSRLVIGICDALSRMRYSFPIFRFFGKNSLIVFGTHLMLIGIVQYVRNFIHNADVYLFLSAIIIMTMEIPIIYFFNGYAKKLIGK